MRCPDLPPHFFNMNIKSFLLAALLTPGQSSGNTIMQNQAATKSDGPNKDKEEFIVGMGIGVALDKMNTLTLNGATSVSAIDVVGTSTVTLCGSTMCKNNRDNCGGALQIITTKSCCEPDYYRCRKKVVLRGCFLK